MDEWSGGHRTAADEVAQVIRDRDIQTLIVGAPDINGVFRGRRVKAEHFVADPTRPFDIAKYIYIVDLEQELIPPEPGTEGWWPDWSDGFGSYRGFADFATFRVAEWLDRTAIVLLNETLDGQPLEVSPRHVLRRIVERAGELGYTAKFAAELEFFLLRETSESFAQKGHRGFERLSIRPGVFSVYRMTLDEPVIGPMVEKIHASGIGIEVWTPEGGTGQYEINIAPAALPEAADRAFLFKHAVKEIASGQELMATFMAKTAPGFGSSCHVNQSLVDASGTNLFWDDSAPDNLSVLARHFVAGQLATMRDFTVLFAPTVNSYKRLLPFSAAGITANWGFDNRTTGLRVLSSRPETARIEHRTPGGDTNPYLTMAACLAGGLHGIEQKLEPPDPFDGNGYLDSSVARVPGSLEEAIVAFEESDVAKTYLGEEFVRFFAKTRRHEAIQAKMHVTDWELKRYLEYL